MFKIFPGTFTNDGRKVPIREAAGWKELSTADKTIIDNWTRAHSQKIKFWGVPTGLINNIIALDVDVKGGGVETVKKYHVPQTMSQTTKSGGTHYIFKYPNDGKVYGNRVGFDEGLDIRGEGGYIAHYGFSNVPIAEAPDWLLEQALNVVKEINREQLIQHSPEMVAVIVDEACQLVLDSPEGESNNVLNVQAYRLGQLYLSLEHDTAFKALFQAAKMRGKPDYEATATINSGLKGGSQNPITSPFENVAPILTIPILDTPPTSRWTPAFFNRYDLTNMSKLRSPQIFKDWSTEDIHITTADGGTGKTTLKLYEAVCLALGESFLGFECTGEGRTLFITGEDTREKLGAMLGAMLKQMRIMDDPAKVDKIMNSILVKKDADLCLITKSREGFMNPNPDALASIMEAIEDLKPKMIIFDPISSFWGSESALNDMAKAVAKFTGLLVERSEACVEIINHMGKTSSKDKDMTQFAGRGGTGLPSHSRVSRVLRPVFEEEFTDLTGMELLDGTSAMMCNVNKFSDGSPLYNVPFLIVRDGYLFSRVTLVEQKVKEEQNKMSDNERIFTFIREERAQNRYPNKAIIIAKFMSSSDKISKDRISRSIDVLMYTGHMGDKIKQIENPDPDVKERAFVVLDSTGKEL